MASENDVGRRTFLSSLSLTALSAPLWSQAAGSVPRPNIILVMTDDQGWGDVGYRNHPVLQTPNLDAMAQSGVRFERFYSGAPVCSPTRGSCLTGRHPYRYGILGANAGNAEALSRYPLREQELTLAEILRGEGYATGHYGKWHLGDVVGENINDPSMHGFDDWFSTVRKVSTLDPEGYVDNGAPVTEPLRGDDSKIIMDRAEPFIRKAAGDRKPFFTVIWFHTPHLPVFATPEYRARYAGRSRREQDYWGAITAMDDQVGRLRSLLRELNVEKDTMLWFCSDNGPATPDKEAPGVTAGLRGRKGTLYEGGVRVPGTLVWPGQIREPKTTAAPCSTSDYLPTILEYLGLPHADTRPHDGISLRPWIDGKGAERPAPIAFEHRQTTALIDNRYKLIAKLEEDRVVSPELYDLLEDRAESKNLAGEEPQILRKMMTQLREWRDSCARSTAGEDYPS